MKLHSINHEQRLYVMEAGDGYTCYGFDVLDRKAKGIAAWLREQPRYTGRPVPEITQEPGTEEHFAACDEMFDRGGEFNHLTGIRCPIELVPALIGLEGKRVEADYFDERIRFYVGKSMGWMPAHLRIASARSDGGEALLAEHVKNVRVIK
jgi:hypothetical protein